MNEHQLRIGDRQVTLLQGPAGWGEWSPLPNYPCDPARARQAAEEAAMCGWPPPVRDVVEVNALVEDGPIDPVALAGFPCVKVKVGRDGAVDRVAEVRDVVGRSVAIRIDANGAWDVDTAVTTIARLRPFELELVEQPVASIDDFARVRRRVSVPLAADECVRSPADARRLRERRAADAVVLKVQPLGGVRASLAIAEAAGMPAIVSSMLETSVGIAAGLALAGALPELPYASGLGTVTLLAGDVVRDPLVPEDGVLRVRRPAPDPELVARYEVRT